jgi:PRTRC genetic system protein E
MPFLANLAPLLKGASEVTLKISAVDGGLSVVVIPRLEEFDPDTTDEGLAVLQAALSKPFHFRVPEGQDPDQLLADALNSIGGARAPVVDEIARYREQMADAKTSAQQSSAKKAEKAPKPTPPTAKPAGKSKGGATDAAPEATSSAAQHGAGDVLPTADLFGDDEVPASTDGDGSEPAPSTQEA